MSSFSDPITHVILYIDINQSSLYHIFCDNIHKSLIRKIARHIAALFVLHLRNTFFHFGVIRDRIPVLDMKIEYQLGSEECPVLSRITDAPACIDWRRRRRRRRRWQGDEGPSRGRRTLTGREASQEDYRKQIISVEIPLANSLGTLPRRGISGSKLPAKLQARTEVVEAWRSALQDLLWQQPSDIVDKIIEGSNIVRCKIDPDELCRSVVELSALGLLFCTKLIRGR